MDKLTKGELIELCRLLLVTIASPEKFPLLTATANNGAKEQGYEDWMDFHLANK